VQWAFEINDRRVKEMGNLGVCFQSFEFDYDGLEQDVRLASRSPLAATDYSYGETKEERTSEV